VGHNGFGDIVADCEETVSVGKKSRAQVEKARQGVYERDQGVCVSKAIYGPCDDSVTIQHRVGRGMGGSALFDADPGYLLTMCATHNMLETADAEYHRLCKALGWSVPRWVPDRWSISEVPVFYWDGWHYLVGFDRVPTSEKLAQERLLEIYGE
jgi:hypothetical protein